MLPLASDPAGGGNSDGVSTSKECNDTVIPGHTNICPNNVLRGNVVWSNADDGFDVSFADSLIENNISFDNGPEGTKGFKVLRDVEGINFVGNIAYRNDGVGFEPRVAVDAVYINNLAIGNGSQGILNIASTSRAYNNLALGNGNSDLVIGAVCTNCSNNWAEDGSGGNFSGDPKIVNPTIFQDGGGNIVVTFPGGLTIAEKVDWIKEQFESAFALQTTSTAINAGVTASWVDPITNATSTRSFSGSAPDVGAYEFIAGADTTPPVISSIASSTTQSTASISFATNESATSSVNYGISASYGAASSSPSFATSASFNLSGLAAGTLYHFRISASDASGNLATSSDLTFTTAALAVTAPTVTVQAATSLATSSATLNGTVTADGNASSTVHGFNYGLTTAYGSTASTTDSFGTGAFSQGISGLTPSTTYHFQAFATNPAGTGTSSDATFTTSATADAIPGGTGTIAYSASVGTLPSATPTPTPATTPCAPGARCPALPTITAPFVPSVWVFTRNLSIGNIGGEVKRLQQYLNTQGYTVAKSGAGSKGRETTFFGSATKAALTKFQKAFGIKPPAGYFGPITRQFIRNH